MHCLKQNIGTLHISLKHDKVIKRRIHIKEKNVFDQEEVQNDQGAFINYYADPREREKVHDTHTKFSFRLVHIIGTCILAVCACVFLAQSLSEAQTIETLQTTVTTQAQTLSTDHQLLTLHTTQPVDGSVCAINSIGGKHILEHWHIEIDQAFNDAGTMNTTHCGPN